MMLRSKAAGLSVGVATVLFLIVFATDTSANFGRRGGFGGGGFTGGYSTFNRQSPPRPTVAPSFTRQQPSVAPRSSSGPPVPQASQPPYPNARSTTGPRQLPRTIDPQSPLGRSPAYKGQIAQTGAAILSDQNGKRFSVPTSGLISTRATLISGASRAVIESRFNSRVSNIYVPNPNALKFKDHLKLSFREVANGQKWRTTPSSLQDEMAYDAVKRGAGSPIEGMPPLSDPRYKGWIKYRYEVKSVAGKMTIIHYNKNPHTGDIRQVKFKENSG